MTIKPLPPIVKWPGSKRSAVPLLSALLPEGNKYYEPFVGGGAMLPFRKTSSAVAGDVIPELIALWKVIRDAPAEVLAEYEKRWSRLQSEGHTAFYAIRTTFNASRNHHDFFFLSRTCVNGLIRFNQNGDFNNSLHHTRPGIHPSRLRRVISAWSEAIRDVEFLYADYRETLSSVAAADVVFLDPPYGGTRGRYQQASFDASALLEELERLTRVGARWLLTYDGVAGGRSYESALRTDMYVERVPLPTGNSPFVRLMGRGLDGVVESVYTNFELEARTRDRLLSRVGNERSLVAAGDMQDSLFGRASKLEPEGDIQLASD